MIKKLILIVTVCLFAAGSIINMHLAQNDHNMDFSLADIVVLAQADGECNLCVVKNIFGKTIFSCKPLEDEHCETSAAGYTLRCDNAEECDDE